MLALGGYALWDARQVMQSAPVFADEAQAEVVLADAAASANLVGWIKFDETQINQPIMQAADNNYYLRHNYRDEYATAGSIFLDYRNARDFSDDFAVIYGHRMDGHRMFGDISRFADEEYFAEHDSGELTIRRRQVRLRVLAYVVIDATDELYRVDSFLRAKNNYVLARLRQQATNWRDEHVGGKLLMLSTCDVNARLYRDVLLVEMLVE
ncbi:class B sortase [Candidatus Saccharibacteria bacterium]|nr:class B sortase [Candidatus Saccharibacteria bacterium]